MSTLPILPSREPTLADLDALPPGVKGEILDGVLYTSPRPRFPHGLAQAEIFGDLFTPFRRGVGGPGGWWILIEPGIELPKAPEIAPDLAGWRTENIPETPEKGAPIRKAPDWVCEILSPSTRRYDLTVKRPFYAKIGVKWLWYVDPDARTLQASAIHEGRWLEIGVYADDEKINLAPFDAVEIDLSRWWVPVITPETP